MDWHSYSLWFIVEIEAIELKRLFLLSELEEQKIFRLCLYGTVLLLGITCKSIAQKKPVQTIKGVVVQSRSNTAKPLSSYAMVSARMFSVVETRRFAAGLNNPSYIDTAYFDCEKHTVIVIT